MTTSSQAAKLKDRLSIFFLGIGYPALVAALTFLGYISGLEFYFNILNMILLGTALIVTESNMPFIPVVSMFLFQFSMKNSPESHVGSDFYSSPLIIGIIAALLLSVVLLGIRTLKKQGNITLQSLKSLPMPHALALLSLAFLLGGAGTNGWQVRDMLYGGLMIVSYVCIFYFFCLSFRKEDAERLIDYLVFTTAMMSLVLSLETLHLYLTNESLFNDGAVVKEEVLYGWGMWTMAGQFLAVTIPLCFLGVMRGKHTVFYFITATLALLSTVMTLSRNALLVGGAAYFASLIACSFVGRSKRAFRILTPILFLLTLSVLIPHSDKIVTVLSDYINRGFSDNGRFLLWRHGIESFLDSPIFGKGFFGIQSGLPEGTPEGFSFYPRMMHSTPIQLLGSMGIFGFLSYGYYRAKTMLPFIKHPTLTKTMLGATLLVVISASLIDNFLFLFKHMLFYPIVLALAFRLYEEERLNIIK